MIEPRESPQHEFDKALRDIADYVHAYRISGTRAWEAAHLCLIDSLGCGDAECFGTTPMCAYKRDGKKPCD